MARTPPGKTREKVYRYVRERLLAGTPPTVREVQQAMGFRAVESARGHLNALVAQGRLDRQPGRARGYALPRPEGAPTPLPTLVPLLGHVQAGDLQLALECPSGYVAVEANRHPPEDLFALAVRGQSMTGKGIFPDDVVIVRRQPTADTGDIVVALVEDEATVKTLRRGRGGRPELHPANPRYKVIRPDPEHLQILGKVVEVRRYI